MESDRYVVIRDRYNGIYSGSVWTAWEGEPPDEVDSDDVTCMLFWEDPHVMHGRGVTPLEALENLILKEEMEDA